MTDSFSEALRRSGLYFGVDAAAKDYNAQDAKFIREMIPHHEMAIEMADKQIKKGKNSAAIDLAKSIKSAQEGEIETMRAWLKARDLSENEDGGGM